MVLTKGNEIPDGTINDNAIPQTYSGNPDFSYTGTLCTLEAKLYKFENNGWVDISSTIAAPSSFTTSDAGMLANNGAFTFATNNALAEKPRTTY